MESDANPREGEPPVLVVGAGPVGLAMACELRRHGVACRIVDDGEGPTPTLQSRALAVHARTMEVLHIMGLADSALERGRIVRALNAYRSGRRLARIEPDFAGLETPYPFVLSLSQGATERLFIERLEEQGGAVEWRTRLVALQADAGGVAARLAGPDGSESESRFAWLIGCDGAHSAVRHQLGLTFEGSAYDERFLLADATMSWDFNDHEGHIFFLPDGPIAALPLPDEGYWRLIDVRGEGVPDEDAAVTARLREDLGRAGFTPGTMAEPVWASAFGLHRRAVDSMRVGRVFLAGDSAHIHSPAGGQGMNTGIQDAVNLAWKLALVVRGLAADALLDSYQAERHPVAVDVLRFTDRFTKFATMRNPMARALRGALLAILSRTTLARRMLARSLSELRVSYRGSSIIHEDGANPTWQGPRPGDRLPDVPYGTGRLYDLLRPGRHVLLWLPGDGGPTINRAAPDGLVDVHRVADDSHHLRDLLAASGECLYLIRPDGYVAYRSLRPDARRLDAYLRQAGYRVGPAPEQPAPE
jgi:2-polyprenyl-6-methoxyphenol hydroxylase-like FAD-dependent oxidoreductase